MISTVQPLSAIWTSKSLSTSLISPSVLPEAIRLVQLRARVPRYQREVLRELARREADVHRPCADARAAGCGFRACRGAGRGCGVGEGAAVAGGFVMGRHFGVIENQIGS